MENDKKEKLELLKAIRQEREHILRLYKRSPNDEYDVSDLDVFDYDCLSSKFCSKCKLGGPPNEGRDFFVNSFWGFLEDLLYSNQNMGFYSVSMECTKESISYLFHFYPKGKKKKAMGILVLNRYYEPIMLTDLTTCESYTLDDFLGVFITAFNLSTALRKEQDETMTKEKGDK